MLLHPKATVLPFAHQGPFITTGDGAVLCFDKKHAHRSVDEGVSWESFALFHDSGIYAPSTERTLVCTRAGTVIAAWVNLQELQRGLGNNWGGSDEEFAHWILPVYVCRSHDHGRTWDEPILINRPWCGCVHSMIQTRTGRIVLVGQEIIPAWRHATVMFFSDDDGASWQRSNVLDIGVGEHDHAGSCEGTVIERRNGDLYLLIRNESGFLYEATSHDDGLTWLNLQTTTIPCVTCCPQMGQLSDATVALLWNAPPRYDPAEPVSRDEMSIAISHDEGVSWGAPIVVAADYDRERELPEYIRASYPYLYERRPGELWITAMYGDVRIKIDPSQLSAGEISLPPLVVMFGDSTTARRPGEVKAVYPKLVQQKLIAAGLNHVVANRGVGGHNTSQAMARFQSDVLALQPQLVVIQFGLNDAAVDVWQDPPATGPRVAKDTYISNLRQMIIRLKTQGIRTILMTPNRMYWSPALLERYSKPPYNSADPESFNHLHLDEYCAALRVLAAEENIPLVDINQVYLDADAPRKFLLERCQQHPNDLGHKLVADLLAPVVIELLKKA